MSTPTNNADLAAEILRRFGKDTTVIKAAINAGIVSGPLQTKHKSAIDAFKSVDTQTLKARDIAIKLSKREEPVLITGESGTGKELLATILHGERFGKLVAVNTTAISENLLESALFGHRKGSFTGAYQNQKGLIEEAQNGTLFLDEIGDMPSHLQAKLLRVIEQRTYTEVGDTETKIVGCRFIFATHRQLVGSQHFRADLYQRIAEFRIRIPALRDRQPFEQELALHVTDTQTLDKILTLLTSKDQGSVLPGNVRQLKSLVKKLEVLGADSVEPEDYQSI